MSQPPRTSWAQRLALIAFGLALLLLGEFGLRLLGFGGHPEIAVDLEPGAPEPQLQRLNPAAVSAFFPRTTATGGRMRGNIRPETFLVPKPPGTLRVLFFGESTVEGFPWPRHLSSAAFLQAWLEGALPGRRVEVLNLGATAVASFPIRKLAEQAIPQLEPDLVVIYGAHNEYFGAAGQASLQRMGSGVEAMQLLHFLRGTAFFQAFAGLLPSPGANGPPRREQLIEVMAAQKSIPPASPLHEAARHGLERNFAAVVRLAKSRGVPVVLATVASNERDLAPLGTAQDLAKEDDAQAHFVKARALDAAGDRAAADEHYRLARDLDPMPWRAGRDKNRLLRALAEREGAALADCEASFAAAAGGAPGWQLFDDHVHPSLPGQALLARTVLDAVARERLLPLESAGEPPHWQNIAGALGATPLDRYRVAQMMATLFKGPPLGEANPEASARFEQISRELLESFGPIEHEAIARWKAASDKVGEPLPIAFFALAHAVRRGDPASARRYARAALNESDPISDVRSATYVLVALVERLDPQNPQAEVLFRFYLEEALRVEKLLGQPTALQAAALSGLYALAGQRERAAAYAAGREKLAAEQNERSEIYLLELPDLLALFR